MVLVIKISMIVTGPIDYNHYSRKFNNNKNDNDDNNNYNNLSGGDQYSVAISSFHLEM